jgi:hypothetical protein
MYFQPMSYKFYCRYSVVFGSLEKAKQYSMMGIVAKGVVG